MPPREPSAAAAHITSALDRVSRRLRFVEWSRAVTGAVLAATLMFVPVRASGGSLRASVALGAIGAIAVLVWRVSARRSSWTRARAAMAAERSIPASHNLIVTAEELLRHADRARSDIRERVFVHAVRVTRDFDASEAVPIGKTVAIMAIAVMVAPGTALVVPKLVRDGVAAPSSTGTHRNGSTNPARFTVSATITPPSYTGDPAKSIENPDRIEALEGSRVQLMLRGADDWRVRFGTQALDVRRAKQGASIELTLAQSGYLALEPDGPQGRDARKLIPVVVNPDRAPTIRIDTPGKDLLLPNAKPAIGVGASASDDYGLASLELRYTKISGSGEQFEFQEGRIPLQIARANNRSWKADAELAIARLGVGPGDSLVYRVVGRDLRPGDAGLSSSDTYFVEVAGPGQVALEGFELPPDRERYALSQQMIVLKLERLRARERTIDRAALEQEVVNIAAEQRAVRANFIFLTGGTVEDEEEEASHSHEIQEGRLENTARREIALAIQHMGRAEQGLAAVDTGAALPPARAAVEALQRAFGRNRYFLRTVPVRSRVDPSRRLSGNISEAAGWRRELFPASDDEADVRARRLLARVIEVSPQIVDRTLPHAAMTAIAEEAISIDAASTEWQAIAKTFLDLRDGQQVSASDRKASLDRAAGAIAGILRRQANVVTPHESGADALRSAWQDSKGRK